MLYRSGELLERVLDRVQKRYVTVGTDHAGWACRDDRLKNQAFFRPLEFDMGRAALEHQHDSFVP